MKSVVRAERLLEHVAVATSVLLGALCFAGTATAEGTAETPKGNHVPAGSTQVVPPSQATLPGTAGAYQFESDTVCPFCAITPQFPEGRSGLHWHDHWRAAGTREYVTIGLLTASVIGVRLFVPTASEASWDEPILFDGAMRSALRIDSTGGRSTAGTISDVLFAWEVLHPTVVDPLLVAWWQRESPRVAWQMTVINAQSYGLTLLVNDLAKRVSSRARPWVSSDDCAQDPSGEECGSGGRYQAFYSGHAAVTATGAGLLCAHHTQLSLYQNDFLDAGTCLLAVAGTAVTGAMRIASDNHWASDVIIGHAMGYMSGYLFPTLFYYKEFRTTPHDHPAPGPTFAAAPIAGEGALGVSLFGQF